MKKRVLACVAVGLLAAGWSPARAEGTADVDAAVFLAPATSWTALPIVGGSGEFGFSSTLCVVASVSSDGGEGGPVQTNPLCSFGLSGSYAFVVCGVGTMSGTAALNEATGQYLMHFQIEVVAGIGVLTGAASSDGGATFTDPVIGVVVLTTQSAPTPPLCLTVPSLDGVVVSTV